MPPDAMSYPGPQGSDGDEYPVSDGMGETGLQQFIIWGLTDPLRDYFARLGRDVLVGADQFFYWVKGDRRSVIAPDVYLIEDETMAPRDVDCWKVWDHDGKAPALALEIVSEKTHKKDYRPETHARYEALGVGELVRFDPDHIGTRRRLLTHWVRGASGRLVQQDHPHDRIHSARFDFWLIAQPDKSLRMSVDGVILWPTAAERLAVDEARIHAAEARTREAESRAREAVSRTHEAEAETARLRAELARLRGE